MHQRINHIRFCYFLLVVSSVLNTPYAWTAEDYAVQYYELAQPLFVKAEQSGDRRMLLEALQFLTSAYNINPKYYDVINTLAKTYYLLGMFENAMIYANQSLALKNDDPSIHVILINIAIRENDLQSASTMLQVLKNQDPYGKGMLYSNILYYAALGNVNKTQEYITRFRDMYPNDILLCGIFIIAQAITTDRDSVIAESMSDRLATDFTDNIFVAWILNEYYYTFNRWEQTTPFMEQLFGSKISQFRIDAYNRQFDMAIQKDNALAKTVSDQFTKTFSRNVDAWFNAGYAFFVQGEYYQAAEYFRRGVDINPTSEFLLFMYDLSLKKGGDLLRIPMRQRTDALVTEAKQFIEMGNFLKAKSLCRRALFIDTIASAPRLLLGRIFQMQGDVNKALNEFEILEKRGITLSSDVEYLRDNSMQHIIAKLGISSPVDDSGRRLMPWRITVEDGMFESEQRKAPFFKEMFLHYLSQFEKVYITNFASPFDADYLTEAYELKFSVYHSDAKIMAQAEILHKHSHNMIFTISSIGDETEVVNTIASLAKRINDLLPAVTFPIALGYDTIVFGAGSVSGLLDDADYFLYDRGVVSLSSQSPNYTTEGTALAKIHVLDVYDVFSTGQLTISTETEAGDTYSQFGLQKLLDIKDMVVIPPPIPYNEKDESKYTYTFRSSSNDKFSEIMNTLLIPVW